jgi:CBS domain-containing protein
MADEPLAPLLDPLPSKSLSKDTTLADAVLALNESPAGELLILDEKHCLWGTLDRDDLYDMIARIAIIPSQTRGDVTRRKLSDLLPPNAIFASLDDSVPVAIATMLDHGISWLPIVRSKSDLQPVGCLHRARTGSRMIQKISQSESAHAQAQAAS